MSFTPTASYHRERTRQVYLKDISRESPDMARRICRTIALATKNFPNHVDYKIARGRLYGDRKLFYYLIHFLRRALPFAKGFGDDKTYAAFMTDNDVPIRYMLPLRKPYEHLSTNRVDRKRFLLVPTDEMPLGGCVFIQGTRKKNTLEHSKTMPGVQSLGPGEERLIAFKVHLAIPGVYESTDLDAKLTEDVVTSVETSCTLLSMLTDRFYGIYKKANGIL